MKMLLPTRAREVLKKVMDSPGPIRIKDLTAEFQVSSRTIHYDLEAIRDWIGDRNIKLESQPNRGIWVSGDEKEKVAIRDVVANMAGHTLYPNQNDRIRILVLDLLLQDSYQTLQGISDKLGVSRNTIIADLQKVEQFLQNWNLSLERKMRNGIRVIGKELQRRLTIEYIIQAVFTTNEMLQMIQGVFQDPNHPLPLHPVLQQHLISIQDWEFVVPAFRRIVTTIDKDSIGKLSDRAIIGFLLRICISIKRIRQNHGIQLESSQFIKKYTYYSVLLNVLNQLSEPLDIRIDEQEINYISLHLIGSDQHSLSQQSDSEELLDTITITRGLIRLVGEQVGIPLEEDDELFDNLLAHLTDKFMKYKLQVLDPNPLSADIIRLYGEMFGFAKDACVQILEEYNVFLTDSDIAYLVMHFQAAVERYRETSRFKAYVVCSTGRGTARLLKTLLENHIPALEVVGFCSIVEIEKRIEEKQVDLVISIIPIELFVPVVVVNPILTQQDVTSILKTMEAMKGKESTKRSPNVSKKALNTFEILEVLKANMPGHAVSLAENISREIIMKGFEVSQTIVTHFRSLLTEQSAAGLTLHLFLMVQRLVFERPYVYVTTQNTSASSKEDQYRQDLLQIFKEQQLEISDTEIDAIIRYFTVTKKVRINNGV